MLERLDSDYETAADRLGQAVSIGLVLAQHFGSRVVPLRTIYCGLYGAVGQRRVANRGRKL